MQDGLRLFEMWPAIDAFEQHGIHILAELFDRVVEGDLVFLLQRLGELVDSRRTGMDILAAAFKRGDDFAAWDVAFKRRVVQSFGKGNDVGGVAADDADTKLGRESAEGQKKCRGQQGFAWHSD